MTVVLMGWAMEYLRRVVARPRAHILSFPYFVPMTVVLMQWNMEYLRRAIARPRRSISIYLVSPTLCP